MQQHLPTYRYDFGYVIFLIIKPYIQAMTDFVFSHVSKKWQMMKIVKTGVTTYLIIVNKICNVMILKQINILYVF